MHVGSSSGFRFTCLRSTTAFAWLAILAAPLCAQTGPKVRDVWYEFVQGDVRYGYEHERVTRQADGTFLYATDMRMLIDLFGSQKQEIRTRAQFVVDAAFRPISVDVNSKDLSGETRVTGTRQGDKLVLRIERSGVRRSVTIDCALDARVPPGRVRFASRTMSALISRMTPRRLLRLCW